MLGAQMGSRGPCCLGSRPLAAPFTPAAAAGGRQRQQQRRAGVRAAASPEPQQPPPDQEPAAAPKRRRRRGKAPKAESGPFSLDDLNPVAMGRKSREVFDDVWAQLQRIGNPTRSVKLEELDTFGLPTVSEFESPRATETTVLVTGATGRVGRVLVRKLLLRGYKVKALVRQREGSDTDAIPQSVELVVGDVGDYAACRKAVLGVDKVICCSAARTSITADLSRVEEQGLTNLTRSLLDSRNTEARKQGKLPPNAKREVADFKNEFYHEHWDIEALGIPGLGEVNNRRRNDRARDNAECFINEEDNLVFEGAVYSRGGVAEVGAPLVLPHTEGLAGCEALVMRVLGDAHPYIVTLRTAEGHSYAAKFTTREGYSTPRLPFNTFRPLAAQAPPLEPAAVVHFSIRFEPRIRALEQVIEPGQSMFDLTQNKFKLEVDWIKAMPGGVDEAVRERLIGYKRRGEAVLRNSGLGYTVVRPGPLVEEAGGYKALVFDQGNRITQSISCADVADVCLKALHDPLARNKTFEVCEEYQPEEGLETYELVAHLPDKSNNYLSPALATLQSMT